VSTHGRALVQLLARLAEIEDELVRMTDWLDSDEPGNSRTASLLDDAALRVGSAARQAQRDVEREALAAAAADGQGHWSG